MKNKKGCIRSKIKTEGISDEDIDAAIRELQSRKEALQFASDAADDAGIDRSVAQKMADEEHERAKLEELAAHLNAVKRAEVDAIVDNLKGTAKVYALLDATQAGGRGSRASVQAYIYGNTAKLVGGLARDLEREGLTNIIRAIGFNGEMPLAREIMLEMAELRVGGKPGVTKVPEAMRMARVFQHWMEVARQMQNREGAAIRKIKGYIIPQRHDATLINAAGPDEWANFIVDRLDDRNFEGLPDMFRASRATRVQWLKKQWEYHKNGVWPDTMPDDPALAAFQGPSNLARRVSRERQYVFKDAQSFYEYHEKFGGTSLFESVVAYLSNAARDAALLKRLGTNPAYELNRIRKRAADQLRKQGNTKAADELTGSDGKRDLKQTYAGRMLDVLDGTADVPYNLRKAQVGATVRAVQTWSSLGSAVFSSLSDMPTVAVMLAQNGADVADTLSRPVIDTISAISGGEAREMSDAMSAGLEYIADYAASRWLPGQDAAPRVVSTINRLFFKLNLLQPWTNNMERMAAAGLGRIMAQNAGRAWDGLPPSFRETMDSYNISPKEWDFFRQHARTKLSSGREILVADAVLEAPTDAVRAYTGSTNSAVNERALADIEEKFRAYLQDQVFHGVLRPGARERAIITGGRAPGDNLGEVLRSVMQFKAFPLTLMTRVFQRINKAETILGGAPIPFLTTPRSQIGLMAGYMAALYGVGYLALTLSDFAKGLSPRDPSDPRTHFAALMKGGAFGVYSDFMFNEAVFGRDNLAGTLLGPTLGDVGRGLSALEKLRDYATGGTDDFPETEFFQLLKSNVPGGNLFYTRAAMDYLIWYDLQEAMNPGTLRRIEGRAEERGQEFYAPPSQERARLFTGN